MMLSSMTGFASGSGDLDDVSWSFEVKSVNGRGLDLRLHLPSGCEKLEPLIRDIFKATFSRGNMQANLHIKNRAEANRVQIDTGLLSRYARLARSYDAKLQGKTNTAQLLEQRGVLHAEKNDLAVTADSDIGRGIVQTIKDAAQSLNASRLSEGNALFDLLTRIISDMETETEQTKQTADVQPKTIMERLKARAEELMSDTRVSEDRLEQELAILVSKADVTEEVDRLSAHLVEAGKILSSNKPAGRKLDFLSQELLREANTLGSKSASLEMTRHSLALKSLIDQFKEQAANVE